MIARLWTARATRANAQMYREHFETVVIAHIRTITGYVSGALLTMDRGDETEIVVSTRWQTMDAVRAFAGDDVEAAVVAEAARGMLLSWDERVRHFTIAVDDAPGTAR